jgi:hypothetical protein
MVNCCLWKGEACFCTCIDILKPGKPALRDHQMVEMFTADEFSLPSYLLLANFLIAKLSIAFLVQKGLPMVRQGMGLLS